MVSVREDGAPWASRRRGSRERAESVGEQEIKVTFQPSGRSGYVLPGTSLIEAAGRMGVILQTPCGGQGTCGKCRVRLVGESEADERSMAADGGGLLSKEEIAQGIRLACQTRVDAPMVVDVPRESTFENHQQILVSDAGDSGEVNPVTRKVRFELVAPSREDVRSDLARMIDELGEDIEIAPDVVRHLSRFLRDNGWRGQAVFAGKELLCVEEPDAPSTPREWVAPPSAERRHRTPDAPPLELPCRLVQIVPRPVVHFAVEQVDELDQSERGAGGFGSTGR